MMESHVYANPGGTPLELDLYRPDGVENPPVALYLHGGGWAVGNRADRVAERIAPVVAQGIAIASASYRLTDAATWPAQRNDVVAAVSFLRDNADELGVRGDRIGAWGASAGGHLALMAALAGGAPLHAVVAFFPSTDLIALEDFQAGVDAPFPPFLAGFTMPEPSFEAQLIGAEPLEAPDRARDASPATFADQAGATRILLVHGDHDGLIPLSQSRLLFDKLREAGADASLLVIAGANHEDPAFDRPEILGGVAAFLR
jgi:acetyl esterase/lipase